MKRLLLCLLSTGLLAGCSVAERAVLGGYLITHRMQGHELRMSDGYLDHYFVRTYGNEGATDTLLFYVQGSGSETAQMTCRFLLDGIPGNVRAYALEKRYISQWSTGKGDPPQTHIEHHTPSSWLADQKEFLKHVLGESDLRGKNIVVFGASAGGMIAAQLAQQVPQITHLVMLGEGGMKELDAFRLWGRRHGTDFDEVCRMVRADPSPSKALGGHSHRWWLETLETDPMDTLGTLEIPVLAVMGEADESVPLETLTYLREEFARRGKTNLTTKVYTGCDHALDECHGHPDRSAFRKDLVDWVRAHPIA
jgi:pimeloyl-ACP methyl ester carboxylesterase